MSNRRLTLAVLGAVLDCVKRASPGPGKLDQQDAAAGRAQRGAGRFLRPAKIHALDGGVLGLHRNRIMRNMTSPTDEVAPARTRATRADHVGGRRAERQDLSVRRVSSEAALMSTAKPTALEYDPALDSWRLLAPMSAGRGSVGRRRGRRQDLRHRRPRSDRQDGRYEFGLRPCHQHLEGRSWRRYRKLRDHLAIGVIDGKIHVAGGRFGACDRFDQRA